MHPCRRRVIITYDEEGTLTDKHGTIEVVPCWKWLLMIDFYGNKTAIFAVLPDIR